MNLAKTYNVAIESEFFNCNFNSKNKKYIENLLKSVKLQQKQNVKKYIKGQLSIFSYRRSSKQRLHLEITAKEIYAVKMLVTEIENIDTNECIYDNYKKGKQTNNSYCQGVNNILCNTCKFLSKNKQLILPL